MKIVTQEMKRRFRINVIYTKNFGDETVRDMYPLVLKLPKDVPLDLALDQSTSQTGLAVFTTYGELVCVVDFINKGLYDYTDFAGMMTTIMKISLAGCTVNAVIYEKHSKMQGKADAALMKLKGTIDMWRFQIPELSSTSYGEIYPQTWRKHFLRQAPEYKGRYGRDDVKECTREECVKRYPDLALYFRFVDKPPDSCDALGIMLGYVSENWKDGWTKKDLQVNNTMQKENNHTFYYSIDLYEMKTCMQELKSEYGEIVKMKFNPDLSVSENCKIATSNTNAMCVLIVANALDAMCCMWETGKELTDGKLFLILTRRINQNSKLTDKIER